MSSCQMFVSNPRPLDEKHKRFHCAILYQTEILADKGLWGFASSYVLGLSILGSVRFWVQLNKVYPINKFFLKWEEMVVEGGKKSTTFTFQN